MFKQTIVFDFDGVIHQGYDGWRDGSIYGQMNWELLSYIEKLLDDYQVVISSTRDSKQIVDYMKNIQNPKVHLDFEAYEITDDNKFWNKDHVVGVTNGKPGGILYIDDRAFKYDNNKSALDNIEGMDYILYDKPKTLIK